MKYRLRQNGQRWIVEYQVKGFFRSKWNPVTTYSGLSEPYYYHSPENAINGALHQIRQDIIYNTQFPNP